MTAVATTGFAEAMSFDGSPTDIRTRASRVALHEAAHAVGFLYSGATFHSIDMRSEGDVAARVVAGGATVTATEEALIAMAGPVLDCLHETGEWGDAEVVYALVAALDFHAPDDRTDLSTAARAAVDAHLRPSQIMTMALALVVSNLPAIERIAVAAEAATVLSYAAVIELLGADTADGIDGTVGQFDRWHTAIREHEAEHGQITW